MIGENNSIFELIEACMQEPNPDAVRMLIAAGADANLGDSDEMATPLMWLVRSALLETCLDKAEEVITILIEAGADLNAQTESGSTALTYAVINGHAEIVELLLKAGADPNIKTNVGWTALDYANEFCRSRDDISHLLLTAGATTERSNKNTT